MSGGHDMQEGHAMHQGGHGRGVRIGSKAVTTTGVLLLVVGAGLIGAVTVAATAAASGPSISVTPHSRLTAAKSVVVTGSGFVHRSDGAILECNMAIGAPATMISIAGRAHLVPVGCTDPMATRTSAFGSLRAKSVPVVVGTLGSWETGDDTADHLASADSALYPCPPTDAQEALGATCAFEFLDNKGQVAARSVTFKSGGATTTTVPVSTTVPVTTTTLPCTAESETALATAGHGSGTATFDPGTCLVNGTPVTYTASGLFPLDGGPGNNNSIGTVIECNSDPNQPTVSILGNVVPLSCTSALAHIFTPNAGGTATGTLDAVEGTTGPACGPSLCGPTDSSGGNPYTDAANYPCPPTAAQVAAGDTCVMVMSDNGGDQISVPIFFNLNV